jgi:hypothetical protein
MQRISRSKSNMPAKDLRIRQSVTIDKTLEEDVEDMPFEYMDPNEKQLTKRQRLLVWNAVNDPQLSFAEAAKKAGYKNPVVIGRYMREGNKYSHVRREYERLMSEAKKKFELTHERAVEDLYKLRDDAWGRGAFNAAIQAQGLLLKVGGLIVDRREVLHGKIDQMSREEVERRLQDLLGSKTGITIENKSDTKAIESK